MHLTAFYLGGNPTEDIGPLANLTQLTFLHLNDNPLIENLGPWLANLAQLRVVHLTATIVDTVLWHRLDGVDLVGYSLNQIENLGPLANLTQLTRCTSKQQYDCRYQSSGRLDGANLG